MWQKQMEEIVCMARQVSLFLLPDGDGTSRVVMKLKTSNIGKWEIMTMGRWFRKCGDIGCVPCNTTCNGSTPCIAWVASYASLRSKYGELFFLIHFFPKGLSPAPFFFFAFWRIFATKKTLLGPLTCINHGPLKKVIKAHFKSNQGPLKRRSNYQGHIDGLDGTRIERHTGRRPSEEEL